MNSAKKQRKTIEKETNDLFQKIGDIKGTFHARMGTIKDRNNKDLTEAEKIKKTLQECTEELYKLNKLYKLIQTYPSLNDQDNDDRVATYIEPDILQCEVKWALEALLLLLSSQSCSTLCNPVDCSMPGFPVLHYLSEFAQTHVH